MFEQGADRAALAAAGTPPGLSSPTAAPRVSSADRLSIALFLAIVAHVILILGITFKHKAHPKHHLDTLDIVLVPLDSEAVIDQPDYLAAVSQEGGAQRTEQGRRSMPARPSAAISTAVALPNAAFTPPVAPTSSIEPIQPPVPPQPETPERAPPTATVQIVDDLDELDATTVPATDAPPAAAVNSSVARNLAIAALSAEIDQARQAYAERPRQKWISARTRQHDFAAYMHAWREQVERVGNLHYPEEATQRALAGNLLLDVALKPDGTIAGITLRRSSGERILDEFALRTVELAAPFPKFPENIAQKVDILHIERTWVFLPGDRPTDR